MPMLHRIKRCDTICVRALYKCLHCIVLYCIEYRKSLNPTTVRVKISQNVDILPKVYLVHLKVKHCQTLRVVSTFTGQNESTVFDW